MEDLDAVVQGKLDADTEFQASIADLPEDEKTVAVSAKRSELSKAEYAAARKEAAENHKKFEDQRTRAEKAEQEAKKKKPEGGDHAPKDPELSPKDLYALQKGDVHIDDFDEVVKAAKLLGKSVQEAMKDTTVQAILEKRVEHRKTAEANNHQPARPGQKKISDSDLLAKVSKGEVPEPGSEDAERLFFLRRGGKR